MCETTSKSLVCEEVFIRFKCKLLNELLVILRDKRVLVVECVTSYILTYIRSLGKEDVCYGAIFFDLLLDVSHDYPNVHLAVIEFSLGKGRVAVSDLRVVVLTYELVAFVCHEVLTDLLQ